MESPAHFVDPEAAMNYSLAEMQALRSNGDYQKRCNAMLNCIDMQGKRAPVFQELRENNNKGNNLLIPRRYKFYLLPLVIVIEIIEMFIVTGVVALTIVTSRLLTVNFDLGKTINTEFTKCVLILTYLHFAQKWKKLMPAISFTCYTSIVLIIFCNIYLFCTILYCDNDKSKQ